MTLLRLKYLNPQKTPNGKVIYYFRHRGSRMPLPGEPLSTEWMAKYQECLDAISNAKAPVVINRAGPGSTASIVASYLASQEFADLAPETRRTRRNIMERLRAKHGEKRFGALMPENVQGMIDAKAATPSAARNLLNTIRALARFAIKTKVIAKDPTAGVTRPKIKTDGYVTWEEEHIAAFEAKHAVGTRARLALALLVYTGQRRADVVTMGRQHVRNGFLCVKQSKTKVKLSIPVHPELERIIAASNVTGLTFLTTAAGAAFSPAGFTNLFRDWCKAADLPTGLSAHGLRKACCRRLAEAGCTEKQIAAISGHTDLREVARYTKAADQARMARAAMQSVVEAFPVKTGTSSGKTE
jgi:integrase